MHNKGVSIIETVVALFILGIIGGALAYMIAQITATANSANMRNTAANFAEEGVEQVRNYRAHNSFGAMVNAVSSNCPSGNFVGGNLDTDCITSADANCPSGGQTIQTLNGTNLCRLVNIVYNSGPPSNVFVRSTVSWPEKGATRTSEADTFLYSY